MTPQDLSKLSVGEFLALLLDRRTGGDADPWIDPKSPECPVPHRQVLAAGQRGELELFKVGNKYFVKKSGLDDWIRRAEHRVDRPQKSSEEKKPAEVILERNGWRKGDK